MINFIGEKLLWDMHHLHTNRLGIFLDGPINIISKINTDNIVKLSFT